MSISGVRSRVAGRPAGALVTVVATLALLLAACGGGGGGGGGDSTEYVIRVAFANETAEPATLQLNDSEPQTVETCKGGVFIFNLPATDWVVTVNGETAVDSLEIDPAYLDKNLVANLWLHEDGRLESERVIPGSNIQAPAQPSICT